MMPAIFLPVAPSMPSRPGEELTSSNLGPSFDLIMSTPATFRPMTLAALTAISRSSGEIFTSWTVAPRCTFALNSPSAARLSIAATTLSPTTKNLKSRPELSLINS